MRDYEVVCNETNNSPEDIDNNVLNMDIVGHFPLVGWKETDISTGKLDAGPLVLPSHTGPRGWYGPIGSKKFKMLMVMPSDYPWILPARPYKEVRGDQAFEGGPKNPEIQLTGMLGTITGVQIHTDCRVGAKTPRYTYAMKYNKRGVEVTVFDHEEQGHFYIYQYRSAREARTEFKAHGVQPIFRYKGKRK